MIYNDGFNSLELRRDGSIEVTVNDYDMDYHPITVYADFDQDTVKKLYLRLKEHFEQEEPKMSIEQQHKDMVARLAKPGEDILVSLTPEKCHLWHMGTGAVGEVIECLEGVMNADAENVKEELGDSLFYLEGLRNTICPERDIEDVPSDEEGLIIPEAIILVGRILDKLKKVVAYNKEMDRFDLGNDILLMKHMMYQMIDRADFTVEEVLQHNIDKLDGKRYKDGYSDAAAQERADKEGEE